MLYFMGLWSVRDRHRDYTSGNKAHFSVLASDRKCDDILISFSVIYF